MLLPDIVFVDTSVFIAENFFAPDNRINAVAKLAKEKKIRLVMPEITRQEVYKHIKSAVRQSWKAFNKDSRIFRNNFDVDNWRKGTNEKVETDRILGLFKKFLAETHTRILDYSYCTNAEKVFTNYFQHFKPFGEGQKKDEFPDAFVLTSLEKYSEEQRQRVVVLSTDSDMNEYESKRLVNEEYGRYISKKVAEGIALDEMTRLLCDDKPSLIREIRDAATDYLDDFRLYLTRLNLTEVSYHSVNEVDVEFNESDYEIISVNDNYFELEIEPEITFKVDVDYVNYDCGYGTEDENYEVNGSTTARATLRYYLGRNSRRPYLEIDDMDLSSLSDAIE